MLIWVIDAKAPPDYRLWLRFSDATQGVVDLGDFIDMDPRQIVRQLRDPVVFASLIVDPETVVWSNGFDLAPEFLRARLDTDAAA
jgi:hypothetical protein